MDRRLTLGVRRFEQSLKRTWCRGAARGFFRQLAQCHSLWRLLIAITNPRAFDVGAVSAVGVGADIGVVVLGPRTSRFSARRNDACYLCS
jgi:hypothetical protein